MFTSCITERRCQEHYPTPIIVDSVIEIKDTVIQLNIHGTMLLAGGIAKDSIVINNVNTINKSSDTNTICNTELTTANFKIKLPDTSIICNTELATANLRIKDNLIKLTLTQKDSVIQIFINKEVNLQLKNTTVTNTAIKKIWVVHWYHKLSMYFSIAIIILIIIIIVIKKIMKLVEMT